MNETLRLQEKLFIIEQLPSFAELSPKEREVVAASCTIVEYKRGDIIYKEDDPADAFYCVITGRLKVYIAKGRARREDIEYLKRGKYFGIVSILTGETHSATVQAINDSIILKIPKDDFVRMLKEIPQLAIHIGQTLSRRLKRKELHEKRVFESTIISIFGTSGGIGTTNYVLNLGISLRRETNKKVIILDVGKTGEDLAELLGEQLPLVSLRLDSPYFNETIVNPSILHHRLSVDIIIIPHQADDAKDVSQIIPLLTFLTNDYHYVLVDLPTYIDDVTFESLRQSDAVHIITSADEPSLRLTENLMSRLDAAAGNVAAKLKVITSEYGILKLINYENKRAILKRDVFATLPDINKAVPAIDKSKGPVVISYPETGYSRAIRRIAREVGDRLMGLALGSGASIGFAHIGILKVIEREKIPIDMLAGTSMGALVGALWAAGKDIATIEKIIYEFRRKIKTIGLMDLTFPKIGLLKGGRVRKFLKAQFGDMTFYDLKLPFKVITCDIEKREEVVLDKGRLVDAVLASVSLSGLFEPVRIGGRLLVDGGIINPLPTNVLMKAGVSKIIAVNTLPSPADIQRSTKRMSNIFDIIVNSVQASEYLLAEMSCQNADIAMHPVPPTIEWYEFYEGSRIVKRGEEEATKFLPQLKALADS